MGATGTLLNSTTATLVMGAAYWSVFWMITLPDTEDWPYALVAALAAMLVRMVAGQRAMAGGGREGMT